jgi:putative ABC transport system substrate-binding protein
MKRRATPSKVIVTRMKRREFITLLGGAAAWPWTARAQQADRQRRVGVLSGYPETDLEGQAQIAAFRTTLRHLGWAEGRNVSIEVRWGEAADPARIQRYAAELASIEPHVIVVHGGRALAAIQKESRRFPVIFAVLTDPLGTGHIDSLARPGRNVTGFTAFEGSYSPKLLEALKEMVPGLARAAFLISSDNPGLDGHFAALQSVAPSLGVTTTIAAVRTTAAIEQAFASLERETQGGMVVASDVFIDSHRDFIVELAARHRLPTIYNTRSFVTVGGLMAYGIDRKDQYRRVAAYVDRILRGEKAAELPIQQPVKFEFALNLKTANALGLIVPTASLLRADEVIE